MDLPAGLGGIAAYAAATFGVIAIMVGLSAVLGQRHRERATGEPYESGIVSTGSTRLRFPAHFYLVAMLFVIFDLEAAFLVAWAAAAADLGWAGFAGAFVFIAVLMVALLYEWRSGALDFGPRLRPGAGEER